jgi:branched-chain amino acid transport system substrate-binding protein
MHVSSTASRGPRQAVTAIVALGVLALLSAVAAAPVTAASRAAARPRATVAPKGEPIVLGNVGTYTAPTAGFGVAVGQQAIVAWAKWVNAHGGINGHPVKLIQKDNKGDQAQAVSLVKQLVENNHVIAFVSNQDGSLNTGYADYLKEKGIPVLGGSIFTLEPWISNPMFYPQAITAIPQITALVAIAKQAGYKKLGSLACAEAAQCKLANDLMKSLAAKGGIGYAYGGLVSSTAPDYTATCLAAKDAGADILALLIATADQGNKIANDCARQNYKPGWLIPGEAIGPGYLKTNAFNNAYNAAGVQPWFSKDPTMKDFHAAMKKYTKINFQKDDEPLTAPDAWVSGLMFQKAVELSGAKGVPTTADILKGLSLFNNETLGGVAGGLSYPNLGSKNVYCYFTIKIKKQKFTLPNGARTSCIPS